MKLTEKALDAINTPNCRRALSGTLDCTEQTIIRYIKGNEDNGPLTTAGALQTIRKETGLKDKQILEQEKVTAG